MSVIKNDVIDTGLVEFVLPFDRGEEKIYFNPSDSRLFVNLCNMHKKMSEIFEQYEKQKNGIENNIVAFSNLMEETSKKICVAFDDAFGNKVSDVIFKYCSPISLIKSTKKYYPIYILEYMMPKIQKELESTAQIVKNKNEEDLKIKEHIGKYQQK